ncbi:hypothetical protein AA0Y32_06040 [Georgenia phoenicis]|uniref:hypothetical protein n=1 Tax=unclassified Georgenia TaxID=2626815 RepID=UPI0039AF05F7
MTENDEQATAAAPAKAKRFDPRKTAERQIKAHLAGHDVTDARLRLAVDRHTAAVKAAGHATPLDWYTRQYLTPTWGVAQ